MGIPDCQEIERIKMEASHEAARLETALSRDRERQAANLRERLDTRRGTQPSAVQAFKERMRQKKKQQQEQALRQASAARGDKRHSVASDGGSRRRNSDP